MSAGIESMTGYAESRLPVSRANHEPAVLVCRARSLNHRFLDVKVRLPRSDSPALDLAIRKAAGRSFKRGAIEVSVGFENAGADLSGAPVAVNAVLAQKHWKSLLDLHDILKIESPAGMQPELPTIDTLLRLPGVIASDGTEASLTSVPEKKIVDELVAVAFAGLKADRQREGAAIRIHLEKLLSEIDAAMQAIGALEASEKEKTRLTLVDRAKRSLQLIAQGMSGDGTQASPALAAEFGSRLREEMAFWLDRRDFEEERVRFNAHLARFRELLEKSDAVGRQLEFVHQELLREINTLGNKAQSTAVSNHVVGIKAVLERLREQLANVE
ncbi:MAG: DUF1732 domain-containing protein [Deltaproteobacteria bacterium]|nr:DUF1732 domain-containing protein [Deltaproteobacteria bacterium]